MNAQCKIRRGLFRFLDMRLLTTLLMTLAITAFGACIQPKTNADNPPEEDTNEVQQVVEDTAHQLSLPKYFLRDSITAC